MSNLSVDKLRMIYDEYRSVEGTHGVSPEQRDRVALEFETAITENPEAYTALCIVMHREFEDAIALQDSWHPTFYYRSPDGVGTIG